MNGPTKNIHDKVNMDKFMTESTLWQDTQVYSFILFISPFPHEIF